MKALHFPAFEFEVREQGQKKLIFDIARKKLIPLTPEEWVRQHALHYLVYHFGVSLELLAVERELQFNQMKKRFDALVFDSQAKPLCIVECKAPHIKISMETVMQIAMYNQTFECPYLWITNGLSHYWFAFENGKINPMAEPKEWPTTKP